MPEGDTVHLAADRLNRALGGASITRSDFRVPRYATLDLSGRRISEVVARGKHLLFRMDDATLHTHFRMDGTWHLYRPGERWREPAHEARVVLETERWVAVGFRLPVVEVLGPERERDLVAHLGPDPLGPEWDAAEALRRLRAGPDRAVQDALLDQSVIAGIGNVYKSEICFLCGIHPATRVGDVGDLEAVVSAARRLMEANRTTGQQITTGDPRRGRMQWVYGRAGRPCRRCGSPIVSERDAGQRITYLCPTCQPPPSR